MSRPARETKPAGSKWAPMVVGLIFGVLAGLLLAGVVAWYILTRNTKSFVAETQREAPPRPVVSAPAASPSPAASAPSATETENKPHFEFYKVLDGKEDSLPTPAAPTVKPQTRKPQPPVSSQASTGGQLQVGAFQHREDAEKQKARLALLGLEASVQTAEVPDKGVWYRVRLGPYANREEMNRALAVLRQNGMNAAPVP